MTRVHGLQHIQGFFRTDLADDDPVRPHTEGIDDQLADVDGAGALHVGGTGFHARHVGLLEAKFGGILDGHDALVFGNIGG